MALTRFARQIVADAELDAVFGRLAAATRHAAELDRQVRLAHLSATELVVPELLAHVRALGDLPSIECSASGLLPEEVVGDLSNGDGIPTVSLRNALRLTGHNDSVPPTLLAGNTAAAFSGSFVLLSFVTLTYELFDPRTLDEVTDRLADEPGAVSQFVCAVWTLWAHEKNH